jgi:hypothetical protein
MEEVDCRGLCLNRECEPEGRQERTADRSPKLPTRREDGQRELPEWSLSYSSAAGFRSENGWLHVLRQH